MVVWRRCSGFLCRTNEGQGSTRVLLQTTPALWDSLACSPALQAHTWLPSRLQQTHWFCILEYSVANKQQDCSTPTLSSADKAQSAKHKLPVLSASLTSSVRQVCSTHFRAALQHCSNAALHSWYEGQCFQDQENFNNLSRHMFSPDLYSSCLEHKLIFHDIIVWLLWLTPTPSICQNLYCYMSDTFGKLKSCALVRP